MHFRKSEKSKIFRKESGAGDVPKPPRLQEGTSVSTLTLGNGTPTAKHFENTGCYSESSKGMLKNIPTHGEKGSLL